MSTKINFALDFLREAFNLALFLNTYFFNRLSCFTFRFFKEFVLKCFNLVDHDFDILLVFFLLGLLIVFTKFIVDDHIIFRRPLLPEELFKEYEPKINEIIAQGKIFAAYALAYKLRIHDFFD